MFFSNGQEFEARPGLPDFQAKNPNLGKFWRVLQLKMLVYFMAKTSIYIWPFGTFCGHLVYFMVILYIFPNFGMLYHEYSGNPAGDGAL
jgi:hypothetical protein